MADSMILSGAEFSIISVARKVVALTIIARYKLYAKNNNIDRALSSHETIIWLRAIGVFVVAGSAFLLKFFNL